MSTPSRGRRFLRALFYVGPLLLWMLVSLVLSTRFGDYNNSFRLIYTTFAFLEPGQMRPEIRTVYVMNHLFRRFAYLFEYGILTMLLVRAIQFGAPRLKPAALLSALLLSILFAFGDNYLRTHTPGRHGGWDDLIVTFSSIVLLLAATSLYFVLKAWERRLEPPAPIDTI